MEKYGVLIAVFVQAAGVVWYVSTLASGVDENTRNIARHEIMIQKLEDTTQTQAILSARIDENIQQIRMTLEKMAQ
ncbi:MAG: hypothetical protein ACO23H_13215 [Alphaproteobacteria bacterium]|jgi:hypothetical protein